MPTLSSIWLIEWTNPKGRQYFALFTNVLSILAVYYVAKSGAIKRVLSQSKIRAVAKWINELAKDAEPTNEMPLSTGA